MNIQTFFYNENFYKKLALTLAIIRSTPNDLTPKEYTIQLQNLVRKKKLNEKRQIEQMTNNLHLLRTNQTTRILPKKSLDFLEIYGEFLQKIALNTNEMNIEIQTIIIETIDRIFDLIKDNLRQILNDKYEFIFKQLLNIMFTFHMITNIQQHLIEHMRKFIDLLLIFLKNQCLTKKIQIIIEQIGCHSSYFLLVIERILIELLKLFENSSLSSFHHHCHSILIDILDKLLSYHDEIILGQIINNDYVRQQFQYLLCQCLSMHQQDSTRTIQLWNLYGRIV